MITITGSFETTSIIKKSKFIGYICRIDSEVLAQQIIALRRKEHYNASHNCFAYVLENGIMRYSDDGEPQSTAGLPMLDVINKNALKDVIIVSTRYFGGTLLGAGGLVRAYTNSAAQCIDAAQKVKVTECNKYECDFSYSVWAKAEKLLLDSGFMIDDAVFSDNVHISLGAMPGTDDELNKLVTSISMGQSMLKPLGIKKIETMI